MKTQCPHCNTEQNIPKEYEGKDVKCLYCKQYFSAKKTVSVLAIRTDQPIEAACILPVKAPRHWIVGHRTALLIIGILISASSIAGIYYGYKRGKKKGFVEGGDAAIELVKIISEIQSQDKSIENQPTSYQAAVAQPTIDVLSAGMRVVEKNEYWWKFAWRVRTYSNVDTRVDIRIEFRDADGFILEHAYLYNQQILQGQKQEFADYILIDAKLARRVDLQGCKNFVTARKF